MTQSKVAIYFLVLAAALLGLTFPLIQNSMHSRDPYLFVTLRFSLASILLLPFFLKNVTKELIITGAILGFLNCCSYLALTIGLQTVNASRAAFLAGTNVIFIALLAPLFRTQSLSKRDIFCALICCLGIYILTGCELCRPTIGDGWVMLCAIFIAITIIFVCYISKKKSFDPVSLASSQITATALFSIIPCMMFSDFDIDLLQSSSFLIPLIYCSIFATMFTFILQIKFQRFLAPQKVGLIFCLEPLFAAFFDWVVNGNILHFYTLSGGFFILLSIVLQELQSKNVVVEAD